MNLDIQYKLNSDNNYIRYIRQNSYWYKSLNRNPLLFNQFVEQMKEQYKIRPADKFNDALEKIQLIQSFLAILK